MTRWEYAQFYWWLERKQTGPSRTTVYNTRLALPGGDKYEKLVEDGGRHNELRTLAVLGADGWELIAVDSERAVVTGGGYRTSSEVIGRHYWFKRPTA